MNPYYQSLFLVLRPLQNDDYITVTKIPILLNVKVFLTKKVAKLLIYLYLLI